MLTVAAGLLRRDRMLLTAPAGESWHNHAHDVVSALIYARPGRRPAAAGPPVPRRPAVEPRCAGRWSAASLVTAAVLVVFFAGAFPSAAGVLQRIGVTCRSPPCARWRRGCSPPAAGRAGARAGLAA